jgi:cysteine dioxygenase
MALSLEAFLERLDAYCSRIPLEELADLLGQLQVELADLGGAVAFDPGGYRRNLIRHGPAYEALVLCWRSGQRSTIHDHRGSSCGVRVLAGTATETTYRRQPGAGVLPVRVLNRRTGTICATQDEDIHEMSNLAADGRDLVTLHVYSPPLRTMGVYSRSDANVVYVENPHHPPELRL